MKVKFKSAISLLTVFATVISLAACGTSQDNKDNSASTTSANVSQQSVSTTQDVKELTLTLRTDWFKSGWQAIEKEINDNSGKLGFKINFDKIAGGDQGNQILKARFASGDMPDLIEQSTVYDQVTNYGGEKTLQEIGGDWVKNFPESLINSRDYSIGGKVYGMPIDPSTLVGVIYNKKLFSELKLEVPKTWEDFIKVCEKVKAAGKTPVYYAGKDSWTMTMLLNEGYISEYSKTPEKELYEKINANKLHLSDLSLHKDSIVKTKELIDKGYVQKSYLSDSYDGQQKAVAEGTAAMIFQGTWVVDEISKKFPDKLNDLGAFAIPLNNNDACSMFVPFALMMTSDCKDVEAGKKFIEYIGSVETQQKFSDAQPGLWTCKGITSKLPAPTEDMKKWMDEGKFHTWYGSQLNYNPPTDRWIMEYVVGGRNIDDVVKAEDDEIAKTAKAKNDPNWK